MAEKQTPTVLVPLPADVVEAAREIASFEGADFNQFVADGLLAYLKDHHSFRWLKPPGERNTSESSP